MSKKTTTFSTIFFFLVHFKGTKKTKTHVSGKMFCLVVIIFFTGKGDILEIKMPYSCKTL